MILIVGCGFLGNYLLREFTEKSYEPIIATIRDMQNKSTVTSAEYIYCDVTDRASLKELANACKNEELTVFYLASCHNVDYVFTNPEKASYINVDCLRVFLDTVPNIKKLFYASTDCVYGDNKNILFSEKDKLSPVNEYGRQKIAAENIVLNRGFTVLRLPFMLGPSLSSKPHFYDNISKAISNGEPIEMIDGMHRSVLSYHQVARLIFSLSLLPYDTLPKIINICGDDAISKYDIGLAVADKSGISSDTVKPIPEKDGAKFFKDNRASFTAMDNTLLKTILKLKEIKWEV